VAIGNTVTLQARPLAVIDAQPRAARELALDELVADWQPVALVVGWPTHADGSSHQRQSAAMRFANRLHARYRRPVWLMDEHGSSREADRLRLGRLARDHRDDAAAAIILQRWFEAPGQALPASAMQGGVTRTASKE
jgi:putative Holliday junction resolvase